MSRAVSEHVQSLLDQAEALSDGPTKVALAEEAVRFADAHNNLDLGYQARLGFITAAIFSGAPEKAMVAFSWCLAHSDRDPERFPNVELLWTYKWIANHLTCFPQLSRSQILNTLDNLAEHYRRVDRGARVVAMLHCHVFHELGKPDQARASYRQWLETPRDGLSDCLACERDQQALYLIAWDQDEQALNWVAPLLDGRMRCRQIPQRTLARVLLPMVRLGRFESAMECHRRGYRLVARNPVFLAQVAEHLLFLALTDNLTRALNLFQTHLSWAWNTSNQSERFDFLLAARFLIDRLERSSPRRTRSLRLPAQVPVFRPDGTYPLETLAGWLDSQLDDLATRFDARNQNDHHRQRVENRLAWEKLVQPFPFTQPRA